MPESAGNVQSAMPLELLGLFPARAILGPVPESPLGAKICPYKRFVPRLVGPDLKQFSRVCSRLVLTIRSAISCFKIQAVCAIILRSSFWARFSLFARDSSGKSALKDGRGHGGRP